MCMQHEQSLHNWYQDKIYIAAAKEWLGRRIVTGPQNPFRAWNQFQESKSRRRYSCSLKENSGRSDVYRSNVNAKTTVAVGTVSTKHPPLVDLLDQHGQLRSAINSIARVKGRRGIHLTLISDVTMRYEALGAKRDGVLDACNTHVWRRSVTLPFGTLMHDPNWFGGRWEISVAA